MAPGKECINNRSFLFILLRSLQVVRYYPSFFLSSFFLIDRPCCVLVSSYTVGSSTESLLFIGPRLHNTSSYVLIYENAEGIL